jgi:hypothetical protein
MTKNYLYVMAAVMACFVSLSMTACSVDYDGNAENDAELIGTWDAICEQYYADNAGYGMPGRASGYWVITARTITEYQQANAIASTTAGYTFDGRRLTIDGRTACEVVTLTRQQMLLRKQVQQGVYQETTFKRR